MAVRGDVIREGAIPYVQCSETKGVRAERAILQPTAIMYTSAVAMALSTGCRATDGASLKQFTLRFTLTARR
jgi:hypothetical protein